MGRDVWNPGPKGCNPGWSSDRTRSLTRPDSRNVPTTPRPVPPVEGRPTFSEGPALNRPGSNSLESWYRQNLIKDHQVHLRPSQARRVRWNVEGAPRPLRSATDVSEGPTQTQDQTEEPKDPLGRDGVGGLADNRSERRQGGGGPEDDPPQSQPDPNRHDGCRRAHDSVKVPTVRLGDTQERSMRVSDLRILLILPVK